MRDGIRFTLRQRRQVRSFRQVLAQYAVRIPIAASLPRAVRVGEVDAHVQLGRERFMSGQLLAPVVGHAPVCCPRPQRRSALL